VLDVELPVLNLAADLHPPTSLDVWFPELEFDSSISLLHVSVPGSGYLISEMGELGVEATIFVEEVSVGLEAVVPSLVLEVTSTSEVFGKADVHFPGLALGVLSSWHDPNMRLTAQIPALVMAGGSIVDTTLTTRVELPKLELKTLASWHGPLALISELGSLSLQSSLTEHSSRGEFAAPTLSAIGSLTKVAKSIPMPEIKITARATRDWALRRELPALGFEFSGFIEFDMRAVIPKLKVISHLVPTAYPHLAADISAPRLRSSVEPTVSLRSELPKMLLTTSMGALPVADMDEILPTIEVKAEAYSFSMDAVFPNISVAYTRSYTGNTFV
jgi:hypothetical protein